jgi:REP element-mobilizing transposase RayT
MADQADERHRRSLRLKGYDYSQAGMYFVTVCAYDRECVFGEIESGVMRMNKNGEIVASEWVRSAEVRPEIECGELVVMPNHFHGIVRIVGAYGNTP